MFFEKQQSQKSKFKLKLKIVSSTISTTRSEKRKNNFQESTENVSENVVSPVLVSVARLPLRDVRSAAPVNRSALHHPSQCPKTQCQPNRLWKTFKLNHKLRNLFSNNCSRCYFLCLFKLNR